MQPKTANLTDSVNFLVFTFIASDAHRRRLIRARVARAPQYLGKGDHAIDEPPNNQQL
jgi:hypothetical protein